MRKYKKDDLLFCPLGGSNEIGMNVNLYHYKGKWLMLDLGAGFADDFFPGIDMLAPDLEFIYERRDDFLGIVLTHAHEDHLGSVGYLWDQLQCPIYATPFTACVARHKLSQEKLDQEADITIVQPGSKFDIGPFNLEMIQLTHSIPEMNAVVLRTEYGNILHTGDWKLDPKPVVGETTDEKALKALGKEGVLAMICDSTNVFNPGHSGSEGDLLESITGLLEECKGLVCVTSFASNVARIHTIAQAAKAHGRKVALTGWSLKRITQFARDTGYFQGIDEFISDKEIQYHPRDKVLVIATGCQGEENAQMVKIANQQHPTIRLTPNDAGIFSSKIIPGNEKKIFKLFNKIVRIGCKVYTEKDHFVHVSGHPGKEELQQMYEWVRPEIAVPVHGEPTHIHEHVNFIKELGISKAVPIQNGEVVKLAPDKPHSIEHVPFGYLGVDGCHLLPADGSVLKTRRRIRNEGIAFVSICLNMNGGLACEPMLSFPGILDEHENPHLLRVMCEELIDVIEDQHNTSDDRIYKVVRRVVRNMLKRETGKKTLIEVHIIRI